MIVSDLEGQERQHTLQTDYTPMQLHWNSMSRATFTMLT